MNSESITRIYSYSERRTMDNSINIEQPIEILNLTLDAVLKDGHDDTILLKTGQVIHINDYHFQSKEYGWLQQLRRDYRAYRTPRFNPTNDKVVPQQTVPLTPRAKSVLELLDEPDAEQPYLIEGLIPRGEFIGVVGKSGVSKSTFCRQLCLSIATKQPVFCGIKLNTIHERSLYVFSEDGLAWLRRYLRRNTKGIPHIRDQLKNMNVVNMNEFENGEALLSWCREEQKRQSYDLIVLDSFSDLLNLFGAKLNDNSDVRVVIRKLEFLKFDSCTVIFNHHVSDKASSIGSFQGATAFRQIVRTQLEISAQGDQRIISTEKNSYGEKFEPMIFNLTENFLFEATGETMTRAELSAIVANSNFYTPKPVGKPKIAPCTIDTVKSIFSKSKIMKTSDIKLQVYSQFNVSEKTAERWIYDIERLGYISKEKKGVYVLCEPPILNSLYGNIDGNNGGCSEHVGNKDVRELIKLEPSLLENNNDGCFEEEKNIDAQSELVHQFNEPFENRN